MRKPRDIDAELKALADKAKGLKARKVTQLGELVIATGAEALSLEALAGALLAAVTTEDAETQEEWRRRGAAFFRNHGGGKTGGKPARQAAPAGDGGTENPGGASEG